MSLSWNPATTLRKAVGGAAALGCLSASGCGFDGRATLDKSSGGVVDASTVGMPDGGTKDAGPDAPPGDACTDPALSFDGIDDAASMPDDAAFDLLKDFTVEAWIKPSAKATTDAEMDVVSHHSAATSDGWALIVKSGRVEIVVYGGDALGAKGYSAGNAGTAYVVPGKWAHIAGTLEGETLRVYYDGVLRDSQSFGTFFGRDTYVGALRLGRASASTAFPYQGELDDVRLSNVARYAAGVAPKPTMAFPVDASTVALWRFDEPSGNVLIDAAKNNHDGSLAPDSTAATRLAAPCIGSR